ncbi:hypothetical protein Tco_0161462 [Tanacetum coccineum]
MSLTSLSMPDHRDFKIQKNTAISTTEAEYIAMSGCVLKSFGCIPAQRLYGLTSIKSFCTVITRMAIALISVDILSNTNFFRAFTASANVPAIYLQQFWNTMKYDEKTAPHWSYLHGNTVIDFVNELGYPEPVEIVSNIRVNYVYQPWRAILTLINQCLTRKTSGSDKPRHPVLQMLWGIVTQTNVDHAELLWEEFTQGIQTFFSHKASHKASLKDPKKKVTPLLIPYGRFSKVIIYYLASNNNIHRRPDSAVHHTGDDFILGNLKFVPKGESVEVFGMAIPSP